MGEDKFENELLIQHGWPEDVWFHVDRLSSAHVYLRLDADATLDSIAPALLEDCGQLVKANSIEVRACVRPRDARPTRRPTTGLQARRRGGCLHAVVESAQDRRHGRWPGTRCPHARCSGCADGER